MNGEINIENMIYVIRGQKVMLDRHLADLYCVETKYLNRHVNRNLSRFPSDFAFQLTADEWNFLRCQFVTSNEGRGGRRYLPYVFTENGVAMLSSVLRSETAAQVNIAIMRIFTKLRSYFMLEKELTNRMDRIESDVTQVFKVVFERLDELNKTPADTKNRKKIGLNPSE